MGNNIKLTFQVETKRIIEILSSEIYDSPLALLRENLQNAYDAVLMRIQIENSQEFSPKIQLQIDGRTIRIIDNGIGMDLDTLQNNFWKAGSSGKRNNEIAQKAGVIGTFGIGAMANFGVCEVLEVITSSISKEFTFDSKAVRDNLKINEDCIDTEERPFDGRIGTEVIATLDPVRTIDANQCVNYLKPYVEYLPIPVLINGVNYSQNIFYKSYEENARNAANTFSEEKITYLGFSYDIEGYVLPNSFVYMKITKLSFQGKSEVGSIVLNQGATNIMCYRNYFGLSSIPLTKGYNFGGFANLSFLTPTAGREALNRDSVAILTSLFESIEHKVTLILSNLEIANLNTAFQRYIVNKGLMNLGKNLTIRVSPENKEIALREIPTYNQFKTKSFYIGSNAESIKLFANENNDLFLPSPSNPRRQIQLHFLTNYKIKQQGDDVIIGKVYSQNELDVAEATILFKINNVIVDDYLITDVIVNFAEISHGVTSKITKSNEILNIIISKSSPSIVQLKHYYNVDYSVLNGFIKDYVRAELYQKFSQFVPSSTKSGADALHKILLKNRELFKIDAEEQGELDAVIAEYINNKVSFAEVAKKSSSIAKAHTQTLRVNQVGTLEQAIPDLINVEELVKFNPNPNHEKNFVYNAMPPLLRTDQATDNLKLLHTHSQVSQLNGFKLFIAISDRLYRRDKDFFFEPHTTKIIWGNHKIVYIFGHISNKITMYYDIELQQSIEENQIGGDQFPTTTIITKDKIFIPIPSGLEQSFYIDEQNKSKEFYIRYDLVTDID
jgi:molecular chaperone HtpG